MKRAILFVALVLAACKEPRTELIIGIATDLRATDNLDSVQLQLLVEGVPFHEETWTITGSPGADFNLPGSFGIYRDGDHDRVQIKLTGLKGGVQLVTREAVLGFIDGKTSFYRMGITSSCMANTCPTGQTCVEGVCKGQELDASMFPSFDSELVNELTCKTPGTPNYLDTATGQAMPLASSAADCPGNLCAEGTCLVPPSGKKTFKGVYLGFLVVDLVVDGSSLAITFIGRDDTGGVLRIECEQESIDGSSFFARCTDPGGSAALVTGQIEGNTARGTITEEDVEGGGDSIPFTAFAGSDVLRYCGTFSGDESGDWGFVTAGGQLSGGFNGGFVAGTLEGTVSGSSATIAWNAGTTASGTATGTVSDDKLRISGTYTGTGNGVSVNGTFSNDQASCPDRSGGASPDSP